MSAREFTRSPDTRILDIYASADPQLVAEAILRENGWSIAPSGNAALNILGLDTQVPMLIAYVSSGPNRRYEWRIHR